MKGWCNNSRGLHHFCWQAEGWNTVPDLFFLQDLVFHKLPLNSSFPKFNIATQSACWLRPSTAQPLVAVFPAILSQYQVCLHTETASRKKIRLNATFLPLKLLVCSLIVYSWKHPTNRSHSDWSGWRVGKWKSRMNENKKTDRREMNKQK